MTNETQLTQLTVRFPLLSIRWQRVWIPTTTRCTRYGFSTIEGTQRLTCMFRFRLEHVCVARSVFRTQSTHCRFGVVYIRSICILQQFKQLSFHSLCVLCCVHTTKKTDTVYIRSCECICRSMTIHLNEYIDMT